MEFMNKAERIEIARLPLTWRSGDPMAVLMLTRPEYITKTETAQVYVCTEGNLGRGVMLLDK